LLAFYPENLVWKKEESLMPKGVIRKYPGRIYPGGLKVLYGGTRTGIRLDRPWQLPIRTDPVKCPFCRGEEKVLKTFDNGWLLLENRFTPHSYHKMIIPPSCWSENKLRILGGVKEIEKALFDVCSLISDVNAEMWVQAYVGALAGQNISHLHYHVLAPERFDSTDSSAKQSEALLNVQKNEQALIDLLGNSDKIFLNDYGIKVVIESIFRAGQCFVVSTGGGGLMTQPPDVLAWAFSKTVQAYANAFRSKQGLAPDFQIFFKFLGTSFVYGSYLPILNHQGTTETVGAILSGGPFVHPWTPEETLEALQKVS